MPPPSQTAEQEDQAEEEYIGIEEEEEQLSNLVTQHTSENEVVYIDLPYHNEVLHIAVNTPQLLDVPHRLFPRILGVLKAKLQRRALKLLEECEGDPNELSRRQLEFTRFRSRVLKQVFSLIQSTQPEQQELQKTNGFEYSFQQNNHSVFDDYTSARRREVPASEEEWSTEFEGVFDKQRKRMNDAFFASLGKRPKVEVEAEEEGEGCGVYLHLKELVATEDPSVHVYGRDWSVMREGGEELAQLMEEVVRSGVSDGSGVNGMSGDVNDVSGVNGMSGDVNGVSGGVNDVSEVNNGNKVKGGVSGGAKEVSEAKGDVKGVSGMKGDMSDGESNGVNEVSDVNEENGMNEVNDDGSNTNENDGNGVSEEKEVNAEGGVKEKVKDERETETRTESPPTLMDGKEAEKEEENMIEGDLLFEVLNNGTLLVSREDSNRGDPTHPAETQLPSLLPTPEQTSALLHSTPQELQQHKHDLLQQYRHFSSQNAFVSEDVILDIVEVLRVFGIPYVFAPGEAEAQCSFLEMMGLVDGIVSNDSDVFAFGGKTLYRNFFVDNRYVEAYRSDDLEKEVGFTQDRIILYAMLEGCDYCEVACAASGIMQ